MPTARNAADTDTSSVLETTDHLLLLRLRHGCEDAATQLYLRYAQRLRALAQAQCSSELLHQLDIEDIVQSVFGSFFRRVREGYYDVPNGEELWRLFLVIALHKIRTKATYFHALKRDARRTLPSGAGQRSLASAPASETGEYAFLEVALAEALEHLPPQHRMMVQLRVEGLEIAEVALKTGRSKRTVERLLQESRHKLRQLLREAEVPCSPM